MSFYLFDQIKELHVAAQLPKTLLVVRQKFDSHSIDVVQRTLTALDSSFLYKMKPGSTVAVGVGSRGIANIVEITRTVVSRLRGAGLKPFIFPAMGSHGGATARGQIQVLKSLGVTSNSVGAPIKATMQVYEIGQVPNGPPLFQGKESYEADYSILICRIKPHTAFKGYLESGAAKMAVIGLGKQKGASTMHAYGGEGFRNFLVPAARIYETNTNLIGAIAVIEDAYDKTAEIVGMNSSDIGSSMEHELLECSKSFMASIPFSKIDVLAVKEIGKNISGTGMDTNIIGRLMVVRESSEWRGPDIATIVVLNLSHETKGHATGIGLANVTTVRVVKKMDFVSTYTNALTAGTFGMYRNAIPMVMADDKRAIGAALLGCGELQHQARIVFISNTLSLEYIWVHPLMRGEIEANPRLSIESEIPLAFNKDGIMTSPWHMETT